MIWTVPPPCAGVHDPADPVGDVEVRIVLTELPVTQRPVVGQEMPSRSRSIADPGSCVSFQAPTPPSGWVELRTSPSSPTATQSEADAQETPRSFSPAPAE